MNKIQQQNEIKLKLLKQKIVKKINSKIKIKNKKNFFDIDMSPNFVNEVTQEEYDMYRYNMLEIFEYLTHMYRENYPNLTIALISQTKSFTFKWG